MFLGDIIAQTLVRSSSNQKIDFPRALKFGLVGLTLHGPYYFLTFSRISAIVASRFPSRPVRAALIKTALAQFLVFPVYLPVFFGYWDVLNSASTLSAPSALLARCTETYVAGCQFWPFVNMLGFMYVPNEFRVLYLASTGLVWNTYLSTVANPNIPDLAD
jgi:protein Mpv17